MSFEAADADADADAVASAGVEIDDDDAANAADDDEIWNTKFGRTFSLAATFNF